MKQEQTEQKGNLAMAWAILICAGVMEAVWAISLEKSNGFSNIAPTIIFVAACALSMIGLSMALKTLPIGTAYSVWVGIGAALTVIYGMATGQESVNILRVLLLAGLVGCIVGLKLLGDN